MVLRERIELSTSPLPRECSTTELPQLTPPEPTRPSGGARGFCHSVADMASGSFGAQSQIVAMSVEKACSQRHSRLEPALMQGTFMDQEENPCRLTVPPRRGPLFARETGREAAARRRLARELAAAQGAGARAPGRNKRGFRASGGLAPSTAAPPPQSPAIGVEAEDARFALDKHCAALSPRQSEV